MPPTCPLPVCATTLLVATIKNSSPTAVIKCLCTPHLPSIGVGIIFAVDRLSTVVGAVCDRAFLLGEILAAGGVRMRGNRPRLQRTTYPLTSELAPDISNGDSPNLSGGEYV